MKRTDKIEDQVRKFEVATNAGKDKVVLDSLLAAQMQSKSATSFAVKAGIVAVAAGIMILTAIWLSGTLEKNNLPPAKSGKSVAAGPQLPSELISVMSLNTAFYRGGMEAVEKQFDQDEKKAAPKSSEHVTAGQLMCELSGDC
jgi:hypothetical protein